MNRAWSLVPLAMAVVLAAPPRAVTGQVGGRQWYDAQWQPSPNNVYVYTTYHSRALPGGPVITHRVVWYPNSATHRNFVYYFSQKSGKIWCRAAAYDRSRPTLWQVLDDNERGPLIGGIAGEVWDQHPRIQPAIPGSEDEVLMEPPPLPPPPPA